METPALLRLPRTRRVLERGIAGGLHSGAQVYVSRRDPGSGERSSVELILGERAPGEPMTADTLMLWLSSTKPVAAVALAQLWERGLLELDDPIARHVPEFAARGKDGITLRHALTHTGGFRLLSFGWPQASWEEIIDNICRARPEPRWEPGTRAGYHMSSSWFILGEVVRRVDGRHFRHYVRQEIFEPLGMDDSWVGMPRARFAAYGRRIGRMYGTEAAAAGDGPVVPRGWHREPHVVGCSPGGNGYGPIRELGRFYEMLLSRGRLDGARILTPQSVEALTATHRVGMIDRTFRRKLDWGLGFIINSRHYGEDLVPYGYGHHASRRTFGHSGFQSSTGFADPVHGLVVAAAVNGNPGEPRHTERFCAITEAIYEDLGLASRAGEV
jgi:CubicO group peptidase (beta-lactamase class C family)